MFQKDAEMCVDSLDLQNGLQRLRNVSYLCGEGPWHFAVTLQEILAAL